MPDWITLDLGIGAVGGSIVAGAVAVYIDHRKRRDEKRNRDRDKKQQVYTQYAQFVGLLFNELLLLADVDPSLHRIENGTANDADLNELRRIYARVQTIYEKLDESTSAALNEIVMIAPKHVRDAATDVLEVCWKLTSHLTHDEEDEVEATEARFIKLVHEFRAVARSDLGIRE